MDAAHGSAAAEGRGERGFACESRPLSKRSHADASRTTGSRLPRAGAASRLFALGCDMETVGSNPTVASAHVRPYLATSTAAARSPDVGIASTTIRGASGDRGRDRDPTLELLRSSYERARFARSGAEQLLVPRRAGDQAHSELTFVPLIVEDHGLSLIHI